MATRPRPKHPPTPLYARLVAGAMLWVSLAGAQDTQLFLRNGDRVTGRILSEDTQRITLTNAVLGSFSLPVAQIERRVPAPVPVPTTNLAVAPPPPEPPALTAAVARKVGDLTAAYIANQITAEEFHRQRRKLLAEAGTDAARVQGSVSSPVAPAAPVPPKPPVKITGEVQAGLDLGFATKDRQFYTGRFKLAHTEARLRNATDYSFTYGYTDGETSANRMDGLLKTDYELTRKLYIYNVVGAGYDELRKLDSYFQAGPGAGLHLLKRTKLVVNLEAGANFQQQNRSDGTQTDEFYYRLAQDAKWTLGPRLSLDQKIEFFPQWNDVSEYRLRLEANVKYWLRGNLFLNFSMIDLYDTMPARGVEPNDLQLRSTIGVKF